MDKKLKRGTFDRVLFGVCRGIANYYNLNVNLIRALFIFSIFWGGAGIVIYGVLTIFMPKDNYIDYK